MAAKAGVSDYSISTPNHRKRSGRSRNGQALDVKRRTLGAAPELSGEHGVSPVGEAVSASQDRFSETLKPTPETGVLPKF